MHGKMRHLDLYSPPYLPLDLPRYAQLGHDRMSPQFYASLKQAEKTQDSLSSGLSKKVWKTWWLLPIKTSSLFSRKRTKWKWAILIDPAITTQGEKIGYGRCSHRAWILWMGWPWPVPVSPSGSRSEPQHIPLWVAWGSHADEIGCVLSGSHSAREFMWAHSKARFRHTHLSTALHTTDAVLHTSYWILASSD